MTASPQSCSAAMMKDQDKATIRQNEAPMTDAMALADEFDGMAKAHRAMGEKDEAAKYNLAASALRATARAAVTTGAEPVSEAKKALAETIEYFDFYEFKNDHLVFNEYAEGKITRLTVGHLRSMLAALRAGDARDEIISQIEERFPNWRSFRDLIDCIDVTLHNLRGGY